MSCGSGGGCGVGNKLNPGGLYVGIRINDHEDGKAPFCDTQGISVEQGQRVVVEGENGFEYAQVTNLRPMILKQCQLRDARRLVRVATDADQASFHAKVEREKRFFADTRRLADEKNLSMKLIRIEETFDGRKVVVYYTSETRVDYRKLVQDLAVTHPVRIQTAKNQNLSLNPSKISGMCGRLMCCLAYEEEGYRTAPAAAPPAEA